LLHVARVLDQNRKIDSTYFGPIHPEAPPFRNPEEDLRKIGVGRTAVIRKGIVNEEGGFPPGEMTWSRVESEGFFLA
jgi:hypothetical protein